MDEDDYEAGEDPVGWSDYDDQYDEVPIAEVPSGTD
jgi:hypothetical protein